MWQSTESESEPEIGGSVGGGGRSNSKRKKTRDTERERVKDMRELKEEEGFAVCFFFMDRLTNLTKKKIENQPITILHSPTDLNSVGLGQLVRFSVNLCTPLLRGSYIVTLLSFIFQYI